MASNLKYLLNFRVCLLTAVVFLLLCYSSAVAQTGTAIWRSGSSTTPLQSVWDGSAFVDTTTTADVGDYRIMAGAEAPSRDEKIVVGVDENKDISGLIYGESSWSAFPFNDMSQVSESFWWGFDVAYESQSGDAMIVWNNGDTDSTGISYRIWNGSDWSDEDSITLPVTGEPKHMRLAANPHSNEMVLIVSNQASKDYALVWDGSSWANSILLSPVGTGNDRTDIFVAYEQLSGHAFVTYSQGSTPIVQCEIWDGLDWSPGPNLSSPSGVNAYARWITLAADPSSDRIAIGVLTNNNEIWLNVWNGSSWGTSDTVTTSAIDKVFPGFAVAFEGLSGDAIAVYGESNAVKTRTWANGVGWSEESTAVDMGGNPNSMFLDAYPNSDKIMLSVQDEREDLSFVFWDGDIWGPRNELETQTTEVKNQPFVFLWDIDSIPNRAPVLDSIGPKSVEEDTSLDFIVTASDPDGTFPILSAENLPENASFLDNGNGQGEFEFDPDYSQAGIYYVLFIANDGEYADSELVEITVTNVNPTPVLDSIGPKTVNEGQNLNFIITASVLDSSGLTLSAEEIPGNASFIDNGDGSGTFDFTPDFDQAGIYYVLFIADNGLLADSELVEITVVLDPLSYITVVPDSAIVSADSTQQFSVQGFSSTDEPRDPGTIIWSLTESIGTIDADGLFDATTTGIGRVVAVSEHGPIDTSAYLEVIPGLLATLEIQPDKDTISADSTKQFTASGYDSESNPTSQLGNLTWEVLGGIGEIDNTGLFDAVSTGNGFIRVTCDLGPSDLTDTITVVPGNPAYIDVTPEENLAIEDSSYQYNTSVYDSDSNYICDTTEYAGWSTTDPSGSITAAGVYTAGNNPSPPTYYVIADLGALRDSAEVIVISGGSLDYIQVEWSNGTPIEDTTFTADDDSVVIYCRGYDSGDNLLGNVAIVWKLVSDDSIATLKNGMSYFNIVNFSRVGSGRISASYSASIVDTTGTITCFPGVPAEIVISPDTATINADSSIQFEVSFFDADGNPSVSPLIDNWGVIDSIGTIDGAGMFDATTVGTGYVFCVSGGLSDTSGAIVVTPGILAQLSIQPDTAETTIGDTIEFSALGLDSDSNQTDVGILTWEVIGDIGAISDSGVFTAQSQGTGRIAATSSIAGIADTNALVTVLPNNLELLIITPDTASLYVDESTLFVATGFDANYDPVYPGELNWEVIGGIGTIDNDGNFTATAKGVGKIAVNSSHYGLADTTNLIVVEVPTVTELPLGDRFIQPGQSMSPVLAFRIANAFDQIKYLEGISLHDASSGAGNQAQVLSNIDSVALYEDTNNNGNLDAEDDLIVKTGTIGNKINLSFSPVTIGKGSGKTFFVSLKASLYPHDGDSLDFYMLTAEDIQFTEGGMLAGPDSINSLGCNIVNGMVAEQVQIIAEGNGSINPGSAPQKVLTVDLPKNGYKADTLQILNLYNYGTAAAEDIDSLILFEDNGDNTWNGRDSEIYTGILTNTGELWSISGLRTPLPNQNNRFYICAALSGSPSNGASIALGVPLKGIEMASDNDGPLDNAIPAMDTIVIISSDLLSLNSVNLPALELIPGEISSPLVAFEFVNGHTELVRLDSLRLRLYSTDPSGASQNELDSQIDSVLIWLNRDGDLDTHSGTDSLIGTGIISSGYTVITTGEIVLPAGGGTVELFVEVALNREFGKNGNTINFGISAVDDVFTDPAVAISGSFPLKNAEEHVIMAFPAASVIINPIPGENLFGGQSDQILLDFELPSDGYSEAVLNSLSIANQGTSGNSSALQAVKLWGDVSLDGFSEDDLLLGELQYANDRWQINGLAYPVSAPNRFLVSVDIYNGDFEGGTARFEIPVGGIKYSSGTNGPDDIPVGNPASHFLLPSDRITVISVPLEDLQVRPGNLNTSVLIFALYNGYISHPHELNEIRFNNSSVSKSSDVYADYELGQISLYYDENANRTFDQQDQLLAAGYLQDGELILSGLDVILQPEALSYFFVKADLPLQLIDSDTLELEVSGASDLIFEEPANINGALPISRGGNLVVDGSIARQYDILPVATMRLSPGENSIPIFAFEPASNGDQTDLLESLVFENLGNADSSDIQALYLWKDDNADDTWQGSDNYIGPFLFSEGVWLLDNLGISIGDDPDALFITCDISADAELNTVVQASLPLNACQFSSGNDGPIDSALVSSRSLIISSSGLEISYAQLRDAYAVGQEIDILINVTNHHVFAIDSVYANIEIIGDFNSIILDSSYIGPLSLEPDQSAACYYSYSAHEAGSVQWQIEAYSETSTDSSAPVTTELVSIQSIPEDIYVNLISSAPPAVIRGQTNIYPFTLNFVHPDSTSGSSPIKLDTLVLRVEDSDGGGIPANSVFARMALSSGFDILAVLESMPSEPEIKIVFNTSAILYSGQERLLTLMADIDSLAGTGEIKLVIENAESLPFVEYHSGLSIGIDSGVQFPLETDPLRIDIPSNYIAISYESNLNSTINYGQEKVNVLSLILRHPGQVGNSQVQFSEISFEAIDGSGDILNPGELFEHVRLTSHGALLGDLDAFDMGAEFVSIELSAPPVLSPGETDTIELITTIKQQAPYTEFGIKIPDSTYLDLRDLSSGKNLLATSDLDSLSAEIVFPIFSGLAELMYPAGELEICGNLPSFSSVTVGQDSLVLLDYYIAYTANERFSPISIKACQIAVQDTSGRLLDPTELFDRVGFALNENQIMYQEFVDLQNGRAVFYPGPEELVIMPGENAHLKLAADLEADIPYDYFILMVESDYGFSLCDVTDTSLHPSYHVLAECDQDWPIAGGIIDIHRPAGRPFLTSNDIPTQIAYPGQNGVHLCTMNISYNMDVAQGALRLGALRSKFIRRTTEGIESVSARTIFDAVHLIIDGRTVATQIDFANDSIILIPEELFTIINGNQYDINIVFDIRPGAMPANYILLFEDSTFIELWDQSGGEIIYPMLSGENYPISSADLSIVEANLSASFTNYPNPFNPSQGEQTRIAFVLLRDAEIDIEIFSITGNHIKHLVEGSTRSSGRHQSDIWAGLNDDGFMVIPGTYICRITARYLNGSQESYIRKVAVLR